MGFLEFLGKFFLLIVLCILISALSAGGFILMFMKMWSLSAVSFFTGFLLSLWTLYYFLFREEEKVGVQKVIKKEIIKEEPGKKEIFKEIIRGKPKEVREALEIKPKLAAKDATNIAIKYLDRYHAHVLSLPHAQFSKESGNWEVLLETDKGFYLVEVDNEGKVVRSTKLTAQQFQTKLKPAVTFKEGEA